MRLLCLAAALWAVPAAAEWQFASPVPITGAPQPGVFHHLEAAGRQSLALSDGIVGLVWEDNRRGSPRAYVAFTTPGREGFAPPRPISGEGDAYAPAITGLGDGRFVVAWEEGGEVRLRVAGPEGLGPVASRSGSQPTLATRSGDGAVLAWAGREGRLHRIMAASLRVAGDRVSVVAARPVDPQPPADQQLYPALAASSAGLVAAWEDRRHGHTRIYYSHAPAGLEFGALAQLNELLPPRSARYGRGTGVTRVALAGRGSRVAGAWMDKRHFKGGYDIYTAVSDDGGRRFGDNEKAQDMFGEHMPQWHPDVAAGPEGRVVVAWDDPRDGTADVWMAWRRAPGDWSDDRAVPGASGPGDQTHPVMAFDTDGELHLAWVEHLGDKGTRLWYTTARFVPGP